MHKKKKERSMHHNVNSGFLWLLGLKLIFIILRTFLNIPDFSQGKFFPHFYN